MSWNRNHHPTRQTGLLFPGLNYPTLALPPVTAEACSVLEYTAPAENGSCFRVQHALVASNSSARFLLPKYSSASTTNRAGHSLFVVFQGVSSRTSPLLSRLSFLSHLAPAASSERRFHLQAVCHKGRKLSASSLLRRDDDAACFSAN